MRPSRPGGRAMPEPAGCLPAGSCAGRASCNECAYPAIARACVYPLVSTLDATRRVGYKPAYITGYKAGDKHGTQRKMSRIDLDEPQMIIDARSKAIPDEQIALEDEADDTEKAFLDEFEINDALHSYHVRLYRVVNGRKIYVEELGADAFPILERLRTIHKGGHFEMLIFRDNKIWKNKTYRVEAPAAVPAPAPSQISELGELIRSQNEQMSRMLTGAAPVAPIAHDPMASMKQMMEIMVLMKQTMEPPKATGIDDFLKMFAVVKELSGDGDGNGRNLTDVFAELIKSGTIGDIVETIRSRPAAQDRIPASDAASQRLAPPPTENPMEVRIKAQLITWLSRAKKDSDPALYAELAIDEYGGEFCQAILLRPDLREVATAMVPETAIYWGWFEQLRGEIHNMLTSDADPANVAGDVPIRNTPIDANGDTQRAGRHEGNAPANGADGEGISQEFHNPPASGKADKKPPKQTQA